MNGAISTKGLEILTTADENKTIIKKMRLKEIYNFGFGKVGKGGREDTSSTVERLSHASPADIMAKKAD